ncbi:hypothetical protein CDO73_10870 [Saccharibacillus sp. O23]|nr:hypothetical protein CDO73_10870 [Saccharibacillus sp. O23]
MVLPPIADLTETLAGWQTVSAALGYDGKAYVLLIESVPEREQGMFPQTELKNRIAYKALIVDPVVPTPYDQPENPSDQVLGEKVRIEEIAIEGESFHYHFLQPLGDELLLVGSRSRYYGRDHYDLNAAVFGRDGSVRRRFLVGDGIQNVQTTAGGLIWTSFFDEGVFGNNGWGRPVGESGLIAWDAEGIRVFTNSEANIADCYALNVVSDEEVWFYYYTDFKLCRLSGPAALPSVSFLDPKIAGSSIFATDGRRFLMDNGYQDRGRYVLLRTDDRGGLAQDRMIMPIREEGEFGAGLRDARGDTLLLFEGGKLYRTTLSELAEAE